MNKLAVLLLALLATPLLNGAPVLAADAPELPVLAQVGPWSVISRVIGYDGRLWFVNSVKGVNHNAADVHSLDPVTGGLRRERHLFSQDTGKPVVHRGLLYWPYEDARFGQGWGHFSVTNGNDWRVDTNPAARIFHIHALAEQDGRLVSSTGAWRGGIQISDDAGASWLEAYDHPTPDRVVSRIVDLLPAAGTIFAHLTQRDETRLLRLDGTAVTDVPGWPRGQSISGLAAFGGQAYAIVNESGGKAIWRSNGTVSERLDAPTGRWHSLATTEDSLWAITSEPDGGALWRSSDGKSWVVHRHLRGGTPFDVAVVGGDVIVSGAGNDGHGIIWGEPHPIARLDQRPALPSLVSTKPVPDWTTLGAAIDDSLRGDAPFASVRDLIYRAAISNPPAGFFEARFAVELPRDTQQRVGGAGHVPTAMAARWALLWGLGLSGPRRQGEDRVPVDLIGAPWQAPHRNSEKYLEPAPIAMWAAAQIGQKDHITLQAIVDRLDQPGDPDWLRADAIGALIVLTGQDFGYDVAAWRAWWKTASAQYSQ